MSPQRQALQNQLIIFAKSLKELKIRVIIPALNEQNAVGQVIEELPKVTLQEIIVVDNGSHDQTVNIAKKAGATVLIQPIRGYGMACITGIDYIVQHHPDTDVVVFLDGDHSDFPDQLPDLVAPLEHGYDLVIGSRTLGQKEKGSMTVPQQFGNWLATRLLFLIYSVKYTDLGPFRAIRLDKLRELHMKDTNYGWTVEMQLKAARKKLKIVEVPVNYRKRIGISKVSGTVKGTIMAGYKILWTIFRYAV